MKIPLAIILSVVLAAGVVAANQLGAHTATAPASTPTSTGAPGAASLPTVQNIVEITRTVPAGPTAVDAFTVPAGVMLIVTDVVVTNTGTSAACGGGVNRAGGTAGVIAPTTPTGTTGPIGTPTATTPATPPTTTTTPAPNLAMEGATQPPTSPLAPAPTATTSTGTLTQTDSTVTGPLCVPAQTTTTLPLTTGIEFASGQVVQLLNTPTPAAAPTIPAAAPGSLAPGSLGFHLRGVLVTLT